jgi:redox-sensitive bicupin YhaK (pirin superfamily)
MSAGTGVVHSEFNPSNSESTRFLQVWVEPEARGGAPGYEQKHFPQEERRGRPRLVASREGRDGSIGLRQDTDVYAATLAPGETLRHELAPGRRAWLQVVRGELALGDRLLAEGDGASFTDEPAVSLEAKDESELLLFDLP